MFYDINKDLDLIDEEVWYLKNGHENREKGILLCFKLRTWISIFVYGSPVLRMVASWVGIFWTVRSRYVTGAASGCVTVHIML